MRVFILRFSRLFIVGLGRFSVVFVVVRVGRFLLFFRRGRVTVLEYV